MVFYDYEKMDELKEEYGRNERATVNKMIIESRKKKNNKNKVEDIVTRRNGTYYVMTKEEFVERAVRDLAIRKAEREKLKKIKEKQENILIGTKENEITTEVKNNKKKKTIKKSKVVTKKKEEKTTTIKKKSKILKHNEISTKNVEFKEIKRKDDNFQIAFAF